MPDLTTYTGGCHCGAVRYRVNAQIDRLIQCNCSICSKTGTLLAFAPATEFTLLSGEDALRDYQFGRKRIHHLFCSRCGIRSFSRGPGPDGSPSVAFNARCLDGFDVDAIPVQRFDGRSRPMD